MKLVIATRNAGKAKEFRELLGDEFELEDLSGYPDVPDVAETGKTFAENAALKAEATSRLVDHVVLADDSGLEVDALDGAPGIYSARYSGEGATSASNITKLLQEVERRDPHEKNRKARFRCVIAVARDGHVLHFVEGKVEGSIIASPRGAGGFGYDPIFLPNEQNKTFGELAAEVKNRISHRARAVAALRRVLRGQ